MSTSNELIVSSYAQAPTRTVSANGVTYAYRELGPKSGPPVIFFVHLAATLDNWDPRIIDPIAKDHHVVTFDNRGVGASSGDVPDSIEAMADDAATFINALGFDKVDIFSFSLGGMVAQALVAKHPDLVRKLVLTGTGPAGSKDIDKVAGTTYYDMLRAALARSDPKEFLFFNRNAAGKRAAKAFVQRLNERTADRDAPVKVTAFLTQLKAIKKWGRSASADLSKITQPTLIANGDNDRMVPSVLSEDLHRRIKGSRLIIYPDAGHGGIFQFHSQFTAIAIEFLDRTSQPGDGAMKLRFRSVAIGISLSFFALALTLMVAPHLLLSNWGLEVSLTVGVICRRVAALLGGIAVMLFLARNAEPSPARSAMSKGLAAANSMLAALGSLELAAGHVASGILVGVFVEAVFALTLLHVGRGQS